MKKIYWTPMAMKYFFLFSIILMAFCAPVQAIELGDIEVPDTETGSLKRGTRFVGLTVSFSEKNAENPSSLFQQIESVDRSSFDISASGGYFIRDLWMLGGMVQHEYSKNDSGYTDDSDRKRVQTISRSTTAGFIMRNYLPISPGGRFSLFVETGLDFGYGKEVVQTTLADDIDRKITETYLLDIGLKPGLMAFIDRGVAIEASVNVVGLSAQWGDYDFNNGERTGNTSSVDLDFSVRVLTMYIGLTFYF